MLHFFTNLRQDSSSTNKKIIWWSGTEPAVSLKYAYIKTSKIQSMRECLPKKWKLSECMNRMSFWNLSWDLFCLQASGAWTEQIWKCWICSKDDIKETARDGEGDPWLLTHPGTHQSQHTEQVPKYSWTLRNKDTVVPFIQGDIFQDT